MGVGTEDLKFRVLASVAGAQAIDGLKNSVDKVQKSAGLMGTAIKALALGYVAKEAVGFGRSILDNADYLNKMSQKTGVAVESLASMETAAELAGVPLENLAKGLNKLSLNIVEAANGNTELLGIFKKLGIGLNDVNGGLKNSGQITAELADKFKDLKDGPEKAAIAIKLFGKSGAEFIPLLNQGSEAIQKFGLAIDQDFAERSEAFNDSLRSISVNLKNSAIRSFAEMLPAIQEISTAFEQLTENKNDTTGFFTVLGEVARLTAQAIVVGFYAVREVVDRAVTTFQEAKAKLTFHGGDIKKLHDDFVQRLRDADAAEKKFLQTTTKNSLLFGEGSAEEIKNRQKEDTAPKKRAPGRIADASAIGENAKILKQFDEKIAKLNAEAGAIGESNAAKETAVALSDLEQKGISKSSAAYGEYSKRLTAAVYALNAAKEKQQASDFTRKSEEEIELQRLQIENYAMSDAELKKLIEAKTLDNQATEASAKFTDEGRRAYLAATDAIKKEKAALIDLQEQQKRTWSVGAREALKDYLESARDTASQFKNLFTQAFGNVEDALVDFVKTGKLNFQKFADDIVNDLIRIQVRAALVASITGITSLVTSGASAATVGGGAGDAGGAAGVSYAANGGVMTARGMVPLKSYAKGGIARSPQMAMFGEGSTPEAYVPLPDGRRIPVNMTGAGSGGMVTTVNINMATGTEDTKSDHEKGAQLGRVIASTVKSILINEKRPGGILN